MDLSNLPNPYDFAHPVVHPDLFIGRKAQMDEIRYYLDHARKAARPMNLAVTGARASGKTSVLNMIQHEAQQRGLCVVRVDLDEGDAETQMAFFHKVFDSILTTACECGAFEGVEHKTYDTYRDMVDAYEVPEDKTFCPFIFPIQYAKAMGAERVTASLSDTGFKRDMAKIREELDCPVAVLFDECDVLTKSRIHLEKLRNIFMNTPGFMLVFTGTPSLFPLMDDVFSPIIRQFKKINVGPFEDQDDTQKCIKKPLEELGITDPSEIFDFETYEDVSEIHSLSGGSPYEIQLLCHLLFRRVQDGRSKRMELTLDVLDDVRRELEKTQDVWLRPVLTAVRNFDREQLSALRQVGACSGYANFEQIWLGEYLFRGEERWAKDQLKDHLDKFEELGVVKIKDGVISFAGDDFDRIYCKYLARMHEEPLAIEERPYEFHLTRELDSFLMDRFEGLYPLLVRQLVLSEPLETSQMHAVTAQLLDESEGADPFASTLDIAGELYWASICFRTSDSFQIAAVTLTSPWVTVRRWYRHEGPVAAAKRGLDDIASLLEAPSERAVALGAKLKIELHTLPVVPVQVLANKVERSDNTVAKLFLALRHYIAMIPAYARKHDIEQAALHADLSWRWNPAPNFANNIGYVLLASGNPGRAKEPLEIAAKDESTSLAGLPTYNLGVLAAKQGNLEHALESFRTAIERSAPLEKEARTCRCLLVPKIPGKGDELEFEEVWQPDLLETARLAASVVEKLLRKKGKPKPSHDDAPTSS